MKIQVVGGGISAATAAALLQRRSFDVCLALPPPNSSRRIIAIPQLSVELLEDLLGVTVERMVQCRWAMERLVAWNSGEFARVSSPMLICEAGELAQALVVHVLEPGPADTGGVVHDDPDWVVVASRRADRVCAGDRRALTGWVERLPGFLPDATTVACVPEGWLFAAADPGGGVAIVLVSPVVAAGVLARQQMLRQAVDHIWPGRSDDVFMTGQHAAAAAFDPMCAAPGAIATGDAALALDPLRGDGVGFAARGALLAQGVIAAIAGGGDSDAYLGHYATRLAQVYRSHLAACIRHYESAWNAGIWKNEIEQMSRCLSQLPPQPAPVFRLTQRDLIGV